MKPFTPQFSTNSKTRRYYKAKKFAMFIKQECDTIEQAKVIAWCHTQVCPSHEVHIHSKHSGTRFVITSQMFPKNKTELKHILEFALGVAQNIALRKCDGATAERIEKTAKIISLF